MIQARDLLEVIDTMGNAYWQSADAQRECFTYHGMEFDIEGAKRLAGGQKKYLVQPNPDWNLEAAIDPIYVEKADLKKPIIFATIMFENDMPGVILIDGHHRVEKAIQCGVNQIPSVTLSMEDTVGIIEAKWGNKDWDRINKQFETLMSKSFKVNSQFEKELGKII